MSIHDQTIKQLVRNRVHELSDRVMDMNIKQGRHVVLTLAPSSVSVIERLTNQEPKVFTTDLPPVTSPVLALENLEDMLSSVRAHQSQGANQ
ncbi:hypothetical protein [Vreelandella janggokensis]|uniref:hypothetical protein n=1 Tax=Vreelandella janggokensis TaxID=370767 RepID=UPI00285EC079|nr:hypothetical protein [Halomonas janggokensis]MDR5887531.1 hypothetical protein [Halomonas janggokensis]